MAKRKAKESGEVCEEAKCAPLPPERVVQIKGGSIDAVWEWIARLGPLYRILSAGLTERATPEERRSAREALRRVKQSTDTAVSVIYNDPLIRASTKQATQGK